MAETRREQIRTRKEIQQSFTPDTLVPKIFSGVVADWVPHFLRAIRVKSGDLCTVD
jgi:hypothetical protein